MTKYQLLERAVEITKEYAKGSGGVSPDTILERVFTKLKELNKEVEE